MSEQACSSCERLRRIAIELPAIAWVLRGAAKATDDPELRDRWNGYADALIALSTTPEEEASIR